MLLSEGGGGPLETRDTAVMKRFGMAGVLFALAVTFLALAIFWGEGGGGLAALGGETPDGYSRSPEDLAVSSSPERMAVGREVGGEGEADVSQAFPQSSPTPVLATCNWNPTVTGFLGGTGLYKGYRLRRKGSARTQTESGLRKSGGLRPSELVVTPSFVDLEPGSYELIDWATRARVDVEIGADCDAPSRIVFPPDAASYVSVLVAREDGLAFEGSVAIESLGGGFEWSARARRLESGVFETFLSPGEYRFTARDSNFSEGSALSTVSRVGADVRIEVGAEVRFRASFSFEKDGFESYMPVSWCEQVSVLSLSGEPVDAVVSYRFARIPGASIDEPPFDKMGGIEISTSEQGPLVVSFPLLSDGATLEDVVLNLGGDQESSQVLEVGTPIGQ